jgi:hypothetical protein
MFENLLAGDGQHVGLRTGHGLLLSTAVLLDQSAARFATTQPAAALRI